MTKTFTNPSLFSKEIKRKLNKIGSDPLVFEKALLPMCEFLKKRAQEKFGHYQTGWAQLSKATQQDRERKGYAPNEPLLRTGDLRDSVEYTIDGNRAIVGSKDIIMVYQEKGTSRTGWGGQGIPPRPVFALTQIQDGKEAVSVFFNSFVGFVRK